MLLHRCMFCLAARSSEIKFDKRGRPYTTCRYCFTRAFFSNLDALRGVAIAPQLIEAALQQRDEGKAPWIDAAIADLRKFIFDKTQGAMPVSSSAPSVVPFVEQEKKENAG